MAPSTEGGSLSIELHYWDSGLRVSGPGNTGAGLPSQDESYSGSNTHILKKCFCHPQLNDATNLCIILCQIMMHLVIPCLWEVFPGSLVCMCTCTPWTVQLGTCSDRPRGPVNTNRKYYNTVAKPGRSWARLSDRRERKRHWSTRENQKWHLCFSFSKQYSNNIAAIGNMKALYLANYEETGAKI